MGLESLVVQGVVNIYLMFPGVMLFPYTCEMLCSIGVLVVVWVLIIYRENRKQSPYPDTVYLQDLHERAPRKPTLRRKSEVAGPEVFAPIADVPKKFVRSEPYAQPPVIGHFNPRPLTPSRAVTMETQTTPYNLRSSRKLPESALPNFGLRSRQVPTRQVFFVEAVEDDGI